MKTSAVYWDSLASNYQNVYTAGTSSYNERLMSFITDELNITPGSRILDIGCGVGKYGIAFAKLGYDVTVTDISPKMIEFVQSNASVSGVCLKSFCANWDDVSEDEEWLKPDFQFVMSTMSPAIHDEKTLNTIIGITSGKCLLTNFLRFDHITVNRVCSVLDIPAVKRFEHPEQDCRKIFSLIASAGYEPQVKIVPYGWSDRRTALEFASKLKKQYSISVCDKDLFSAVESISDSDGYIDDTVSTDVAWIWWENRKEK